MTKQEEIIKIKKDNLKRILIMCAKECYNSGFRTASYGGERDYSEITYIYDCIFQYVDSFGEKKEEVE